MGIMLLGRSRQVSCHGDVDTRAISVSQGLQQLSSGLRHGRLLRSFKCSYHIPYGIAIIVVDFIGRGDSRAILVSQGLQQLDRALLYDCLL
jgi:hypothetical protein